MGMTEGPLSRTDVADENGQKSGPRPYFLPVEAAAKRDAVTLAQVLNQGVRKQTRYDVSKGRAGSLVLSCCKVDPMKPPGIRVGDRVLLKWLPDSVRRDDPKDDVFRKCLGRDLLVMAIEENGDIELDVRGHSDTFLSIFVPSDCVEPLG